MPYRKLLQILAEDDVIAGLTGGISAIGHAIITMNLLQVDFAQWSILLGLKIIEVALVGAVGAFTGLFVKRVFHKVFPQKTNQ